LNIIVTFSLFLVIYLLLVNIILNLLKPHHIKSKEFNYFKKSQELFSDHLKIYECSRNVLNLEECNNVNKYYAFYLSNFNYTYKNDCRINKNNFFNFQVNTNYFIK
jgi:hypothetical protein